MESESQSIIDQNTWFGLKVFVSLFLICYLCFGIIEVGQEQYQQSGQIAIFFSMSLLGLLWIESNTGVKIFVFLGMVGLTYTVSAWIGLLLFVLFLFGWLFIWYRKKVEIKKAKEDDKEAKDNKSKEFAEKREKFISTNVYQLLVNFAKNLKEDYRENEGIKEEVNKLRKLLSLKGFEFDNEETCVLIMEQLNEQDYESFKSKMLKKNPKSLEEYIREFVVQYEKDESKIAFFMRLLKEQEIEFDDKELLTRIQKAKEEVELERFEKKLNTIGAEQVSIDNIDTMSGHDFEAFLKKLFEKMDYKVIRTQLTNDQGADLIVEKDEEKTVVQAKRYSSHIGNKAIQEAVAAIKHYKCDNGMVITNNWFTAPATELAKSNNLNLIDRNRLKELIKEYF